LSDCYTGSEEPALLLEITDLSKEYGSGHKPSLIDLSISVAPGEILGLVGLNGAGKTTTIRIAVGVTLASSGDVRVDGSSISGDKPSASRLIGWVPETPVHEPGGTLNRLIAYYAGMAGSACRAEARESLVDWGLGSLAKRRFRTLSLGERKRFAVAVAALGDPRYFLLDEVFNGLDPAGVAQVREWMLHQRETGHGLLVSSHQLRELQALADRFAVIHKGRLVAQIQADQLPASAQRRLQIVFHPIDDAGLAILQTFGEVEKSGNGVTLVGDALDAGKINRTLVQAGYDVRRLEATSPDLEAYFLGLVQDAT
jgi:ABC-2 type transport system ATP-binding protein